MSNRNVEEEEEAVLAEDDDGDEQAVVVIMRAVRHARCQKRRRHARSIQEWAAAVGSMLEPDDEDDKQDGRRAPRTVYPRPSYADSAWARMMRCPALADPASREANLFRRRFRVPYQFFGQIVELVQKRHWFSSTVVDVSGRQCILVELKVLAALQTLGRGTCFDDISQMSLMSEPVACASFHAFCEHFAQELYADHVRLPTGDDQDKVMEDFHKLGFTGAVGSADVTHVKWDACPYSEQRTHTGKEGYPTLAYQATVDHSGRVLAVMPGCPGSFNDKTIIRFDAAVTKIRNDGVYKNRVFYLRAGDGNMVRCTGNYLLVDNGYHKWRVLMPPTKCPSSEADVLLSRWLEKVRKDIECFFGRLKGRFRFLKLPILFREKERVDNAFFTACMLHNMLHSMDGLDKLEAGVSWSGIDGEHDASVAAPDEDVSTIGRRGGGENDQEEEVEPSHQEFREKLMTSFSYRWKHKDIEWLVSADGGAAGDA
ncbi:unnamed protein product [Sphacelaria rigidula]